MADVIETPGAPPAMPSSPLKGSGPRKAAVFFIFVTALMDILALGLMIPVLPNLVKQFAGGDTAMAADYTKWFAITWGLMQFVFGPIQGMLSDRFGRRPVLLISIFGLGVDYLFMALAPSLAWLYVGRLINGITSASFSTANAYVADVTTPQDRAKAFGLMGAAFGIGFVLGPGLGGVLGHINLRLPFYFSAGLALCNWLYGFFILPESLPKDRRSAKLDWARANPFGAFRMLATRRNLLGLAGVYFLFQLAHNVFPSIFVLFVGQRFNWGPLESGLMLVATGVLSILVQLTLVGRVVKRIGERGALLIGLASAILAFTAYALAPTPLLFLCSIPLGALGALIGPGLQSLMSRRVPAFEQGRLQGTNSAITGICAIAGPLLYLSTFGFAVRHDATFHLPGLPILIAAALCLGALILAIRVATPVPDADAVSSMP